VPGCHGGPRDNRLGVAVPDAQPARSRHNQAELAKRVSVKLGVKQFLGNDFALDDAVPKKTNARDIWDVDHRIYAVWKVCMIVFAIVDAVVILAVLCGWQIFLTGS
jgi:hypothetical protein